MPKKQKIFVEATPLINNHLSGVGQVVLETLTAFDSDKYKNDYEIKAFVPFNEKEKMGKYKFNNVQVVTLPYPHKFFSLFSRFSVSVPLDFILGKGTYIFPNFRNWNLATSKSITYIHDACFAIYPQYVQPRNLAFLQKYINLWLGRTTRIATVSKTSKKEINKYLKVPKSRIDVVQNTINSDLYKPQTAKEVARIKKKYDLKNYFLFVGNIEPRKNLSTLIDAFEKAKLTNTTLFIVGGDGWLNEEVYEKIKKAKAAGIDVRKNKTYIPNEDLPALFSGANATILPSWHEGFGLTALQSIACGTRTICADIPVLREVADGYKNSIHFFKPNDQTGLKKLLVKYGQGKKIPISPAVIGRTWEDATDELLEIARKMKGTK